MEYCNSKAKVYCCFRVVVYSEFSLVMDLKSGLASPVVADSLPIGKSRLGIHSSLIPYSQQGTVYSSGMYVTIPKKKTGVLDDVLANGWLDDMIASSPPRKKLMKDVHVEVSSNDCDASYFSWMVCSFHFYILTV